VVDRALERRLLLNRNAHQHEVSAKYRFENISRRSAPMQAVFRLIAQCAPTTARC
jgi:DNA-binding NtrC family response regulator